MLNKLKTILIGKHKMNGKETPYRVHLVSEFQTRNNISEFKAKGQLTCIQICNFCNYFADPMNRA